MYINTQKTKVLLVTAKLLRRRMDQDPGKLEVVTDTAEIEQVASHKLFGLIIDKNLTYEINFDELCNKFSQEPKSAPGSPSFSAFFYAISAHT